MTPAAAVGLAAVVASLVLIRTARVPSGLIRTGGYGVDIWAGFTALYAAGLALALLPIVPAAVVAAVVAGSTTVWIIQRPIRTAVRTALVVIGIGALAAVLAMLWRPLAAVVFGVGAAVATRRALAVLEGDAASSARLPAALRTGPWRRMWLIDVGLAVGLTAAAPAEESGVVLLLAGVVGAVSFFLLSQPTAERPGSVQTQLIVVAIAFAAVPGALMVDDLVSDDGVHGTLWWAVPATLLAVVPAVRIVFREVLGPFHEPAPRVPIPYAPDIMWVWIGAVRDHSASVVVRPRRSSDVDRVSLHLEPGGIELAPYATPNGVARFEAARLRRDTRYTVNVQLDDAPVGRLSFRTFGPAPRTIRIAAASCASTGSNGRVFDTIAAIGPDVLCELGDLHYENIGRNDPARFRRAYDDALSSPAIKRMMSQVPVAYVFDDHDYGKNDSNRESSSKRAAWRVYRERVPHYELGARDDPTYAGGNQGPVYQRFRIGPVYVVLTDTRSEREPPVDDGEGLGSRRRRLISATQERWLIDAPALAAERGCQVLVWCTSTPWIGLDGADPDTWTGFPEQRRRIANALLDGERRYGLRTVVVCGDAHMVGLDHGRADRDPATAPPLADASPRPMGSAEPWQARVFPAMNAAALDRRGSRKSARYDHFERLGAGQFGLVEVDVDANARAVRLRLVVHDVMGRLDYLTVPLDPAQGRSSTLPVV